jgi:phosphoglycerol geranylgeranyltransferase
MRVKKYLLTKIAREGAVHLTLIDPAKQSPKIAGQIAADVTSAGTDGIMVGGSTHAVGKLLDQTVISIKDNTVLPIILFPASEMGISRYADAIWFMSLLNSTDSYYITGAQRLGAPLVRKFGLESLPMGYIIVEPGGAAGRIGKANLIPRNKPELAMAYALTAQYMGMEFVYLEAGSGVSRPVPTRMIKAVRNVIDATLVVGGGVRTPKAAAERVKAGAGIIVTGTLVERAADRITKIRKIVKAIKACRGV